MRLLRSRTGAADDVASIDAPDSIAREELDGLGFAGDQADWFIRSAVKFADSGAWDQAREALRRARQIGVDSEASNSIVELNLVALRIAVSSGDFEQAASVAIELRRSAAASPRGWEERARKIVTNAAVVRPAVKNALLDLLRDTAPLGGVSNAPPMRLPRQIVRDPDEVAPTIDVVVEEEERRLSGDAVPGSAERSAASLDGDDAAEPLGDDAEVNLPVLVVSPEPESGSLPPVPEDDPFTLLDELGAEAGYRRITGSAGQEELTGDLAPKINGNVPIQTKSAPSPVSSRARPKAESVPMLPILDEDNGPLEASELDHARQSNRGGASDAEGLRVEEIVDDEIERLLLAMAGDDSSPAAAVLDLPALPTEPDADLMGGVPHVEEVSEQAGVVGLRIGAGEELDGAQELLRQFVETQLRNLSEEEAYEMYEMGLTFLQMGEYESAYIVFQQAMENPECRFAAAEGLVQALVHLERYTEAAQVGRMVALYVGRERGSPAGLYYWYGRSMEALGQSAEALRLYRMVIEEEPSFEDAAARVRALGRS